MRRPSLTSALVSYFSKKETKIVDRFRLFSYTQHKSSLTQTLNCGKVVSCGETFFGEDFALTLPEYVLGISNVHVDCRLHDWKRLGPRPFPFTTCSMPNF
jgi:hypothetical protein